MLILPLGSVCAFRYSNWKTNIKVTAFILYSGPNTNKVHALNLSAVQLSTMNRMKLINIISKLSKLKAAEQYSGRMLYRIFRKYAPNAIRQCYRTYFKYYVYEPAIINYGLNNMEYVKEMMEQVQSPIMYQEAKRRIVTNLLRAYTQKHVTEEDVSNKFSEPSTKSPFTGEKTPPKSGIDQTTNKPIKDDSGQSTNSEGDLNDLGY